MSLIKRNHVSLPSLMNEFLKPDWFGGMEALNPYNPAVNIKENELDYSLELVVPGREKKDFEIEIDNDVLTISTSTQSETTTEKENYTRREFVFGAFKRAFTLPDTIAKDSIDASYENGILKFILPKKEEALPKPKRAIELK